MNRPKQTALRGQRRLKRARRVRPESCSDAFPLLGSKGQRLSGSILRPHSLPSQVRDRALTGRSPEPCLVGSRSCGAHVTPADVARESTVVHLELVPSLFVLAVFAALLAVRLQCWHRLPGPLCFLRFCRSGVLDPIRGEDGKPSIPSAGFRVGFSIMHGGRQVLGERRSATGVEVGVRVAFLQE